MQFPRKGTLSLFEENSDVKILIAHGQEMTFAHGTQMLLFFAGRNRCFVGC